MKKKRSKWLIIALSVQLAGCSSVEMIQSNMDAKSYPMTYAMDSVPPVTQKKSVTVSIEPVTFDLSTLSEKTIIQKEKRFLFPLGIVNVWENWDNCIQGKSMFKDDLPSFVQSTLEREINYLGLVTARTNAPSEYSINVSIDKIRTEGLYKRSGISLLMYKSRSEIAGPAVSNLTVSYTLKKGNQVVKQNTFSSSKRTDWKTLKYADNAQLQQDYAAGMVKAVAYNLKQTNRQIVDDLNDYFSKQR